MNKDEGLKLLPNLEEAFHEAKTNPNMSLRQIRQLYFELQCLRRQLLNVDEEETEKKILKNQKTRKGLNQLI